MTLKGSNLRGNTREIIYIAIDTLKKGFARRWAPKARRARRFYDCDEFREALKTGDPAIIERVREMLRKRKWKKNGMKFKKKVGNNNESTE